MSFDLVNQSMSATTIKLLGEQVIVHSKNGRKLTSCYAVIDKNVEVFPGGFESGVSERMNEISLLKSDATHLTRGDLVVHGSTRYVVQDILDDDGVVVKVSAK